MNRFIRLAARAASSLTQPSRPLGAMSSLASTFHPSPDSAVSGIRSRSGFRGLASAMLLALVLLFSGVPADAAPPVNVNSATASQLAALPGIGPAKAKAIVEEREKQPFGSVSDLERVSGIGSKTVSSLREYVTVGEE